MKPFEPIPLGHDYWLDADERQWILYRIRVRRTGEGRGKALKDKRDGKPRREVLGYFATLEHAFRTMSRHKLRTSHTDEWGKIVQELGRLLTMVPEIERDRDALRQG